MKNLENLIYQKLTETPQSDSIETIESWAKKAGFETNRSGTGNLIVRTPPGARAPSFEKLKNLLAPLGFEHDITRGGTLGRLVLPAGKDENGNRFTQTTVVVKPIAGKGGGGAAAQAGKEYEEKLANYITDKYSDKGVMAITAGSGHGSDLEIIADGRESMRIEVKTKMAADFGQFKIGFDVERGSWNPIRTSNFLQNEKLYSDVFKAVVKQYANSKAKFTKKILKHPSINLKNGVIRGLKPNEQTGITKRALEKRWFSGVTSVYLPFSFEKVSKYYASKGDRFIQIGTKGLFALNREDAKNIGAPYFGDVRLAATARIRIKPHSGTNGTHSFTVAIKLAGKIENSPINLNNDSDLDMIIDKFLDASPIPIEESQGWSELHYDEKDKLGRLTRMMIDSDACCDSESISGLWSDSDPQYAMSFLIPEPEWREWDEEEDYPDDEEEWTSREKAAQEEHHRGIPSAEIDQAREELGEISRRLLQKDGIAQKSPDESGWFVKVWRCGSTKEMDDSDQPVTSVTWSEDYAYRFCKGKKEYTHHEYDHTDVDAYYVNLKDVLVSIPHVWSSAYDEKELLVRPEALVPVEGYQRKMEDKIYERLVGEEKEINYKDHASLTFDQMEAAVEKAGADRETSAFKKATKNVIPGQDYRTAYDGPYFKIVVPVSTKASCLYGAGSKWCTAAADPKNNWFRRYYNDDGMTLYYVLPKKVIPPPELPATDMKTYDITDDLLDNLFEGKLEDLKKKYPHLDIERGSYTDNEHRGARGIDKLAWWDPTENKKYLPWMVKQLDQIVSDDRDFYYNEEGGIKNRPLYGATQRIADVVNAYHTLLPYIGKKKKQAPSKKGKPQERTRFDKMAVVLDSDGVLNSVWDAQNNDLSLGKVKREMFPTWGIKRKDVEDTMEKMMVSIHDDLNANPNPGNELVNYWNYLKEEGPMANVDPGIDETSGPQFVGDEVKFRFDWMSYVKVPMPKEIGNYQSVTGDDIFSGADRGRRESFAQYVSEHLDRSLLSQRTEHLGMAYADINGGKLVKKQIGDVKIGEEPHPGGDPSLVYFVIEQKAGYQYTQAWYDEYKDDNKVKKLAMKHGWQDMRNLDASINPKWSKLSPSKAGAWGEPLQKQYREEIKELAKDWIENNPRQSAEEEKAGIEKGIEDIMSLLEEDKTPMSLEEKLYRKMILKEVSYEDALKTLDGKKNRNVIKNYNYERDPKADPERGLKGAMRVVKNTLHSLVPDDIEDGEKGESVLWLSRMFRTSPDVRDGIIHAWGGADPGAPQSTQFPWGLRTVISTGLETFFQHKRHMKINQLDKIESPEMLDDVVSKAKDAIEAEKDKAFASDAVANTEFFTGNYMFETDENGEKILDAKGKPTILRGDDGVPLFNQDDSGWVIAAAHSKGAACVLGKKTNWCTASPGLDYFKQYYGGTDDPLFYIHTPDDERYQFSFGKKEFMDVDDVKPSRDKFEELHDQLKDTLEGAGQKERFEELVFDYEHVDIDAILKVELEEIKKKQSHPVNVDINYDVDDDGYENRIHLYCTTKFVFARNGGTGDPLASLDLPKPVAGEKWAPRHPKSRWWSQEQIDGEYAIMNELAELFYDANGRSFCVGNEDCEDEGDNIAYGPEGEVRDPGVEPKVGEGDNFSIEFSFHRTIYASAAGYHNDEASSADEAADFFRDVDNQIDGKYETIAGTIRKKMLEMGVVNKNDVDEEFEADDGNALEKKLDNFKVFMNADMEFANIFISHEDLPRSGYDLSSAGVEWLESPEIGKRLITQAMEVVRKVTERQMSLDLGAFNEETPMYMPDMQAYLPPDSKLDISNGIVNVDTGRRNVNKEPIPMGLPRPRYWGVVFNPSSAGTAEEIARTKIFFQNFTVVNNNIELFKKAFHKLLDNQIKSMRESAIADSLFIDPIDPDTIIGPITEVQEPLQEISYDDARSSVNKQGTKLIKGWNYDHGKEPTKDLEGMLRAFRGKVLHFMPRDIEDGQKAQATLWLLRQIKKSQQRLEDFINPVGSIIGNESYGALRNNLEKFFQHNTHMKPKGLDDVISIGALNKVVKDAKPRIEAASAKELAKNADVGTDILRDDEEWKVAVINNKGAACTLGKDTDWCTAAPGLNYFEQYYKEDDPLFYIENKGTEERWQFHYGSSQFMDVNDSQVDREKWEELHDILKGALEKKDYEEKYPKVWDYEHKDWDEEIERVLNEQREHIDHRELTIDATADLAADFDDDLFVTPSFRVEFLFDRPADKEFADDLDILGYEEIGVFFIDESGGIAPGDNSENIQDDAHEENITIRTGHTTVQVIVAGFKNLSSYDEGDNNEVINATDRFLQDVRHTVDDNYNDIKDKIRGVLIKHEMLEGTKYDRLVDDFNAHDGFTDQFEGLGVSIFPDDRTIRFQISFLKPDNAKDVPYGFLAGELASNKDFMFRIGMKALQRLVGKGEAIQQGLPGTDTPADESAPQAVEGLIFAMQNHQYLNKFEPASEYILATLDLTLSTLTAWNDLFVAGMKVVSQNKKAAQASLTMAVQKYIEKYPDKFPQQPELAESANDEVVNEIEPYQKKAKKWQKRALKLSIKGGNKYLTKGMKIASTKLGKSAPPGG